VFYSAESVLLSGLIKIVNVIVHVPVSLDTSNVALAASKLVLWAMRAKTEMKYIDYVQDMLYSSSDSMLRLPDPLKQPNRCQIPNHNSKT
jgi:hypothetical protein